MCYQLPCLLQPSVSFVVCPIKSLMYDQQLNMKASYVTNTNSITSDLSAQEKNKIQNEFAQGKYLFIWISPERFQIKKFREYIADVYANLSISYAVIDEVHCMSEWGHDFRTSYLNLTKTIQRYCPSSKFIGLTATASINVLKDIKVEFSRNERKLGDENIKSLLDYSRRELEFEIIKTQNKFAELEKFVSETGVLIQNRDAGLIFTPHVNGEFGCFYLSNRLNSISNNTVSWYSGEVPKYKTSCFANQYEVNDQALLHDRIRFVLMNEGVNDALIEQIIINGKYTVQPTRELGSFYVKIGNGIPVLDKEKFKKHKTSVQNSFKKNTFPVLVATKAFGMGIDKGNIKYTVHYGIPSSVEALYQEAGRAGRWIDKSRKAKCKVLYTPETTDIENVNRLFDIDTTFSEIKDICDDLGWNEGKDIFKNIILFIQGQRDILEEFKAINLIVENYFRQNSIEPIYFTTIVDELEKSGITAPEQDKFETLKEVAQKAIYRLRILGIVNDWTTDFVNHFEVEFNTLDEDNIKSSLSNFILKYESDFKVEEVFDKISRGNIFQKSTYYLLKWTFENIAYNRKQSLKTLADWCDEFEEIGNEAFKRRIDNYFRFTDTTFLFQHIAENPREFKKWFEVFYVDRDLVADKEGVYIPEIEDEQIRQKEFERLRDSLSRFLESYRNNVGLNVISGLIRLSLDNFENQDGMERFESGLSQIKDNFPIPQQLEIIEELKNFGGYLSDENKENLCFSIVKYYPNLLEELADYYGLFYLLDDAISKKVNHLKKLNTNLYEEFEQIGTI